MSDQKLGDAKAKGMKALFDKITVLEQKINSLEIRVTPVIVDYKEKESKINKVVADFVNAKLMKANGSYTLEKDMVTAFVKYSNDRGYNTDPRHLKKLIIIHNIIYVNVKPERFYRDVVIV
uniref:Uncharacterized protein n=1 Tax=Pithovirus LCDPAC01 TaxID=2506600 RepID=A0A481YQ92_9VIRU|nr:MAG: hypothetical protein LCDPAC01_00740 [Pithovirus LCDPAC01]